MTDFAPRPDWHVRGVIALLTASVAYNLPLSILNAHGPAVGRTALIGVEALLMACGLALVATRWRPEMTRWLLMIALFFVLQLVLTLARGSFDPKSFRDTMMFAVFVMTGMLVPYATARRTLVALHIVIFAVLVVELSVPDQYAALLNPRSYFINSRGFTPEQLMGESDLFGAVHDGDRVLFPQLGWNRASSIFLEPLSLGNYSSFATLLMLLFWRDWGGRTRLFMAVSTVVILIGSDGRFAAASAAILLLAAPVLRRLPAMLAAFYLPLGILVARVASIVLEWNPLEDNFPGRMARGMKGLFKLDWADAFGASIPTPLMADSGIAYLVVGQTVVGVILLQLFLFVQPGLDRSDQRLVVHGTALTFALSILVSISMLSIKTAGFYWFLFGVMLVLPRRDAARVPAKVAGVALPQAM